MTSLNEYIKERTSPFPPDWKPLAFGSIAEETHLGTADRGVHPADPVPVKLVKMGCLDWGCVDTSDAELISLTSITDAPGLRLKEGDFLFNTRNSADLVGKSAVWSKSEPAIPDNNILVVRLKLDQVSPSFLCRQMCHGRQRGWLSRLACGSTSVAAIYWKDLSRFPVFLPSLKEQKAINSVLNVWDDMISISERRVRVATIKRKALIQQLLTGKRRFPGFAKPWRKAELAELCTEESIRNNGRLGNEAVRAVNKSQGMIPMKDHVISDDLTRYKVIKPGWYAYNPMRINIGSICQWDGTEDALVSPDYVVFRCLPDQLDQSFFNAFRRSFRWDSFMARAGSGGVRVRIYFDDLGSLTLPIPCLDEQRRIGALFDTIDREIMLLERLLAAYQRQKRGLMQQLLTGKRRVRVPAATGER